MAWVFNPFTGTFDFTNTGGGGGGSPGGSSGQVQYNNGGAFGGMSGTTWTDASQSLAIASTGTGTGITTSSPVLNLSQTWNDGAGGTVTFTGLKFNATDTLSASGSLLLDLQVGGTSKTKVDKFGNIITAGNLSIPATTASLPSGLSIGNYFGQFGFFSGNTLVYNFSASGMMNMNVNATGGISTTNSTLLAPADATWQMGAADAAGSAIAINSVASNQLTLASNHGLSNGAAVIITGSAAPSGTTLNTLYYARSISAAVLELYDTYQNAITTSGTTGRVSVTTAGTSASVRLSTPFQTFQPQSFTGTDIPGQPFIIKGSRGTGTGAGGSIIFQVAPAGSSGTAQNAYATALTINSTGKATFTPTVNSTSTFEITNLAGSIIVEVDSTNRRFNAGGSGGAFSVSTSTGATTLYNAAYFGWQDAATAASGNTDVRLYRDTTSTLALRNGGTSGTPVPQTFNIYNYWASASDYERLSVAWSGNICSIRTNAAGSGTGARQLVLGTNNGSLLALGALTVGSWNIDATGVMQGYGNLLFGTDNTYDIGASGANRPRNIYAATSVRTDSFYTTSVAGFYYILNRFSLQSAADGTVYFTNAAGTDFNRLQFGGTTSSFPALKRISSGNCLQVIAADNTASAGFIVGNQALATSATDGFLYVPTCAGTPTGTPTTQTGTAPIVVDTTNNKLYFYSGGAWRDAGP